MDVWGWIVIYALGLTLLQLLVYRYLLNGGEPTIGDSSGRDSDRSERYVHPEIAASFEERSRTGVQTTPTGERICPNCGAENEADTTFDLCWNCTRRIR
ncbi:hypothetical protein E6P09_01895 [Haloferax mediterranei ATCC 33500]|nr:hypothetical protein [Haloferax mediterranei]AHZ23044.1 hypothetical protein BM92_10525 [Haloferax mediterranei ATCC 33500]ELZ99975.1 hypothetical protein C439_11588 [Haloferax mediterranei ATCC 33500]MDX5987603.1 hypothetical protein [Haloferax mediterranei ATCC 33500]QCQ74091.1 hypothetical protein E6P09_01895 [Haloferax mediterranei ATCC 33500]